MINRQRTFSLVVQHLRNQGEKAASGSSCNYRRQKSDGKVLKCAIGALISDSYYFPGLEGQSALSEMVHQALDWSNRLGGSVDVEKRDDMFLEGLQTIHDEVDVHQWEEALRRFATKWNVTFPERG